MARLFISHERIAKLSADRRVVVDGDRLDVPALAAAFRIRPAVRFVRVAAGGEDVFSLVGRVKSEAQVGALGGVSTGGSLVIDGTTYECERGFLGEVVPPIGAAAPPEAHLPQ